MDNATKSATIVTQSNVEQFKTIRSYYTTKVVAKVRGRGGLTTDVHHADNPDAIPLFATMLHDISGLLKEKGMNLKLYSPYPFPNRTVENKENWDSFAQEAWNALREDPKTPFVRTEEKNGSTVVRVAISDPMVSQGCVNCHNGHPDTPRVGWKLGDLRGVLEMESNIDEQIANGRALSNKLVVMLIVLLIILFTTLFFTYKTSIGAMLNTLRSRLEDISNGNGDLTKRLDDRGEHEIALIGRAFNGFMARLQIMVKDVDTASRSLTSYSHNLEKLSKATSEAMHDQEDETNHVANAVTDMTTAAKEIAHNATNTASATQSSVEATNSGRSVIEKSMASTTELSNEINNAMVSVENLKRDSEEIGGVLSVIQSIAEQTNLLALNAAIEAARAGEQGRGFAVVADEVRTLAGRTQQSTLEIQETTERLQRATDDVVKVMEASQEKAQYAVTLNSEVEQQLDTINDAVDQVSRMNELVATASEEQELVAVDIKRNLDRVQELSEITKHDSNESNDNVKQLIQQIDNLHDLTDKFIV